EIVQTDSPRLETLKMQLLFDSSLPIQYEHLKKSRNSKTSQLALLLREILDFSSKNLANIDELYRKIVMYVIIKSELGDPMNLNVIAGLESTFPTSEVHVFISLPRPEKETQLNGLVQLVAGIRLFNKDIGKGGEGIEDLPSFCDQKFEVLDSDIGKNNELFKQLIQRYTAMAKVCELKEDEEESKLCQRSKEALIFCYQIVKYLEVIRDHQASSLKTLSENRQKYFETIKNLKQICKAKTAVPVDHVYPLFMIIVPPTYEDAIIRNTNSTYVITKTDVEIINTAADLMSTVGLYNRKIEVLHPGNSSVYHKLYTEYAGFCPTSVATKEAFLIPGTKNVGILRYKDQLFSFASFDAAIEFAKAPEEILKGIVDMACSYPQLVYILNLHRYFPTIAALENVRSFAKQKLLGKVAINFDASCQTDTHIIDQNIDPDYEWNEWEMRRKAIMLVNLRHKRTHAAQTDKSHFRRENFSQHYEPKVSETQTKKDSSTKVPKKVNFLAGLRHDGKKGTHLNVVDLTLNIG
ncbi:hypothetical protein ROZALSC1DRAFT_31444, partial [Rozella allomycis CSF55]